MARDFHGKRVAILATKGVEQVELTEPRKALDQAGAHTELVSPEAGKIRAWNFTEWGDEFDVDVTLDAANPDDYDALLLPGGVMNPDHPRLNDMPVAVVRRVCAQGKATA